MSMSATKYPLVFRPLRIGPVEVRNRVYMPPHGLGALTVGGAHGSLYPSDQWAHYFAERAANGVGLIIHSNQILPRVRLAGPIYEESIPAYSAVAAMVHKHGARIFSQLHHVDRHNNPWDTSGGLVPMLAPTERQRWGTHSSVREINRQEISLLLEAYRRCARNLTEAGYDGIEIHASHGTIHEQFLSPYFNKRSDEYGGDEAGRLRLLAETIQAVRAEMRPDMAMGLRLNVDQLVPGGLTIDDTRGILARLIELRLIDFADLDIALEPQQQYNMTNSFLMPPLYVAGFVKKVRSVGKDKIAILGLGGRITSIAQAEQLLVEDAMDMVGIVRGLLAEPEMLKNAMEDHEERNRVCIAHNYCIGGSISPLFGCMINPASGREGRWGISTFTPATNRCKVTIVGGGPAGLEAARVAALRGHDVTVFEQRKSLGGQLNLWAATPQRELLRTTVDWYVARLAELGVHVRLGAMATASSVLAEKPDAILISAGARYQSGGDSAFAHGAIPGAQRASVLTPEQILEHGARPTGRVLILDEQRDHSGPALAELLARSGASVEIMSSSHSVLGESVFRGGMQYQVIPILRDLGIALTPEHYIKEIGEGEVIIYDVMTSRESRRGVDWVVLLTMRTSQGRDLEHELLGTAQQVYAIGDAAAPRGLFEAVYDGQRFARLIGEPDAPRTTGEALFTPVPDDAIQRSAATLLELAVP
jgi:2,4-dienoyl-CoA reductase-like NADH-dependent reductase (Old Yellow Enzyme family)